MLGRESGNQGRHIHFISYAYGLNRDILVDDFKKGECPKSGFHVKFQDQWEDKIQATRIFTNKIPNK